MLTLRDRPIMQLDTTPRLTLGELALDPASRVLSGPAGHIQLTARYFSLTERLLRRPGTVIEHSDLIGAMYPDPDDEPENSEKLLYQAISRLRLIVELMAGRGVRISNVQNVGYRMHERAR